MLPDYINLRNLDFYDNFRVPLVDGKAKTVASVRFGLLISNGTLKFEVAEAYSRVTKVVDSFYDVITVIEQMAKAGAKEAGVLYVDIRDDIEDEVLESISLNLFSDIRQNINVYAVAVN